MLYFAYGSNLNVDQMRERCPRAVPLGALYLRDYQLIFRGVADIRYRSGTVCPGALWSITEDCERALDKAEGFNNKNPDHGLYYKEVIQICNQDNQISCEILTYRMHSRGIMPPSRKYYDIVAGGYRNFRLPLKRLKYAVVRSYDQRILTVDLIRRYEKKGRPELIARPNV